MPINPRERKNVKKLTFIITVLMTLFPLQMTPAQGTPYVSNLGNTSIGSAVVGSDSWVAQEFGTGTNSGGYILNSVQLLMGTSAGTPSGFTVSLYGYEQPGVKPGPKLASFSGLQPSAGGVFTYSTPGIMLLPGTYYSIVVTADTPVSQGAYDWSAGPGATQGGDVFGDERWRIGHLNFTSTDGLNWDYSRSQYFQMALYATPVVPEPTAGVVFGLGLAAVGFWRQQKRLIFKQ